MSWRDSQRRLRDLGYALAVDGVPGPQTYGALFADMGAKDKAALLGRAAGEFFPPYEISTPLRVAHWLAQFGHESKNFTDFEEDLSYSAERLCAVWPVRFPTIQAAAPYAHNPQKLAEKVYGGRLGNGEPGDGWKYRGRGPHLTGKYNYRTCGERIGLPLVDQPELAADPAHFVHIACDFWQQSCCNTLADRDDLNGVTKKINGGLIGVTERGKLLARAKAVLS
jgi:putative chitinase